MMPGIERVIDEATVNHPKPGEKIESIVDSFATQRERELARQVIIRRAFREAVKAQ